MQPCGEPDCLPYFLGHFLGRFYLAHLLTYQTSLDCCKQFTILFCLLQSFAGLTSRSGTCSEYQEHCYPARPLGGSFVEKRRAGEAVGVNPRDSLLIGRRERRDFLWFSTVYESARWPTTSPRPFERS